MSFLTFNSQYSVFLVSEQFTPHRTIVKLQFTTVALNCKAGIKGSRAQALDRFIENALLILNRLRIHTVLYASFRRQSFV
jgi:hypothetical protein